MMNTSICRLRRLGTIDYQEAWDLQNRIAQEIAAGTQPPTLLLLEHPHTYTFGRSGHIENLLWDEAELERRGVRTCWVDRGGDVTYHGPGQLVGYPLLPLAPGGLRAANPENPGRLPQADYVGYLRRLESVLIDILAQFGVAGRRIQGLTGVWVDNPAGSGDEKTAYAKIAAIGVKVDARGISRHGFALNVNPDMSYWEGIIGCGLDGYPIASLADLLGLEKVPAMQYVMDAASRAFAKEFNVQLVEG